MATMLDEAFALKLAREMTAAWNSHDLERILEHYEEDVTLTSPYAAERYADTAGVVRGKAALRAYFALGLAAYPELHFELVDVLWGVSSVVLYYVNQRGTMTAEVLELSPSGRVARVLANYSNAGPRAQLPVL
jgi:ketosteroid isomerase-like protein